MNYQDRTKEELITELTELQQRFDALKLSLEISLLEQNSAEDNLKANEEKFRLLFNRAPLGYQSLDADGNFIEVNQQWLDTLGYERDEVIGKWFGDFLSSAHQDGFRKRFPIFKEKGQIHSEFEMVHKDGSRIFIGFDGKIAYDSEGRFMQTHCILKDITEILNIQKALKESEERFRVLFEAAPDAIILADYKSGKITEANQAACLLTGKPLEEILGMNQDKLHPPQNRDYSTETFNRHIHESLDAGKTSLIENVVLRPDGSQIPVEILAQVVKLQDQTVLMGTFRDITGRKHAEAMFKDIIDKNPMSVQILDMNGYTIQTNSAHTKLFGVKTPADYSIFKDAQLLQQGLGELFEHIKNGEVVYFPDSYFNVNDVDPSFPNVPTWIKAIGFTLNDINDKPERIVLMHENITGRKHAEAMFQDIIDKNPMSIQIVDINGFTLLGNPAYTQLFGTIPPPGFSIFDDLQHKSPELEQLILRAKSGEIVHLPDLYYNPRDVSPDFPNIPLWIRAIIFPLKDSSGRPERFVLMHENITERKLAENKILQWNETLERRVAERTSQLDAINKELAFHLSEVEQFTYIASHDLQEPLRTLATYTQLINEEYAGKLDADGNKYIEFISGSASRMRALVTALLEYSLLGKAAVLTTVDCNLILGEVLADMADSLERSNANVSFQELPVLKGYETELRQLFQNLINNAVKFRNKEVRPEIKISAKQLQDEWLFSIEDNGIGIMEKDREKIFVIFKRMHNRNDYEGTGIGLAHCKKIAEMHGGRIWVESTHGKGSTFMFTLPQQ